jgi:FkbM family methyltransferase
MQPSTENPKEALQPTEIKDDLYHQELDMALLLAIFERLENKTVIDIGAEKGSFLQAFLDKGAVSAFSFEPYPPHVSHLKEKYSNDSRVRLFDLAVGERNETVKLHIASDPSGKVYDYHHTLLAFDQTSSIQWNSEVAVSCRRLDSLVGDGTLPPRVGILKTDTEGNDFGVIAGMGDLEADVVMIEFWDDLPDVYGKGPYSIADLDRVLRPRGFSNFVLVKRHDELSALQINDPKTRSGDWGNVIFIHDRVFAEVSSVIFAAAARTQNTLIDKALGFRDEGVRRLDFLNEATRGNNDLVCELERVTKTNSDLRRAVEKASALTYAPLPARIFRYGQIEAYIYQKKLTEFLVKKCQGQVGVLSQHKPRKMRVEKFPPPSRSASEWPSIAIVTPSFMQGSYLERTIKSVLSQNYPKLSYIVQDGGSKDNSVEIIKANESRLAHWESAPDGGQADAIALGFKDRTEDIMAWLNSDDILMPGALAYIGDYFAANPSVDVIYGHRVVIDENDKELGRWVLPEHYSEILKWADYVPQETLFWRRKLFNEVGGIDTSFRFAIDWDLLVKFVRANANIVRLPYFLGCFRVHPQQKTSSEMTASTGDKEMERIRRSIHGRAITRSELSPHIREFLFRSAKTSYLLTIGIRR